MTTLIRSPYLLRTLPFFLYLIVLPLTGHAGPMDDAIEDGKTFSQTRNTEIKTMHNEANVTGQAGALYQGEAASLAAPQSDYYTDGTDLETEGQTQVLTDDNARYINRAHNTRPHVNPINRATNPLLTHKPALETNAANLATTYSGCTNVSIPGASAQLCGSQLICPDGNCTADIGRTMPTSTGGFQKAATYMALLQEMKDTFDPTTLEVFRGEHKKCKRPRPLITWDCCNDSSSSYCNLEERELEIDNDVKRTHYVGTYNRCQARIPIIGTCIWWHNYKSYCVFPSKLARIIVVQGRVQINKPYGNVRNPNCTGFTLDELATVDFEPMDLSEFHEDVDAQADAQSTPDVADAADDIKQKIIDRGNQNP